MNDKLSIRPVEISDCDELNLNCWPDESSEDTTSRVENSLRWMSRSRGYAVSAEADDRIVGFGQVIIWGERGEISDLIVATPYRSKGIGTQIINTLLMYCHHLKLTLIEIGVNERNTKGRQLYERLGFSETYRIADPENCEQKIIYLQMELF